MSLWLDHPQGRVRVHRLSDGRVEVTVVETAPNLYVSRPSCACSYPAELIERLLQVKGPGYLCDEILCEVDPEYVRLFLRYGMLGFLPHEAFRGARILDFGSGSGASTVNLTRLFSDAEIVGAELEPDFIDIARMRAEHYGITNCSFLRVPDSNHLPEDIGTFGFVNLGAVYEHLLPDERRRLLPQLWSVLKPGGVLFVNQLPYRYYPIEQHTTGLPLLNYLPAPLARRAATALSQRVDDDASWPLLLRAGIRGGSEREIRRDIVRGGGAPESLTPNQLGLGSHADLWHAYSARRRPHPAKKGMRVVFRLIHATTATNFLPGLSLAFRKKS